MNHVQVTKGKCLKFNESMHAQNFIPSAKFSAHMYFRTLPYIPCINNMVIKVLRILPQPTLVGIGGTIIINFSIITIITIYLGLLVAMILWSEKHNIIIII